jgi:hypothetical protein
LNAVDHRQVIVVAEQAKHAEELPGGREVDACVHEPERRREHRDVPAHRAEHAVQAARHDDVERDHHEQGRDTEPEQACGLGDVRGCLCGIARGHQSVECDERGESPQCRHDEKPGSRGDGGVANRSVRRHPARGG